MKVLGVDPGSYVWGYGVVETGNGSPRFGHLVECGVFTLPKQSALPQRLAEIHRTIADLILRHRPTALALETPFYHKNVRTTLVLGQTRGVVLLAAQQAGIEIAEYPPATVKKTVVGRGGAQKQQVGAMVARILQLRHAPQPHDAADGVAVALTHIIRS
ncbi:MAG: crossover junction endodeoxyribonuclease RuvC [Gemmatimonadales bacterium]